MAGSTGRRNAATEHDLRWLGLLLSLTSALVMLGLLVALLG